MHQPLKSISHFTFSLFNVGALCLFLAGVAKAESSESEQDSIMKRIGPSVSLRSGVWTRDRYYSSDRGFVGSSVWLNLKPEPIEGMQAYVDAYVINNDFSRHLKSILELREGYLERSFGLLDLRIGRQVLVWGRADKVNPTDQWTTKNMRLLGTDDEDQRLGVFTISGVLNLGDYRLMGVLQPEWRDPVYPIPPISGVSIENLRPQSAFQQFGIKVDHTGGAADYSLSYSNVISRMPNLTILSAGVTGVRLGLNFEKVQVFGADFAWNFGEFGLRGETAYTHSRDPSGGDPLRFNSEIFSVLGVDRSWFENFNFNLQFLHKHVFDFQDGDSITDPNLKFLARQQNLIANQLGADRFGISLRPSYKIWNDTLDFEIAYLQWFYEVGGLFRPKVTYAINDHLKVIAGLEKYFGIQNSFFGRLSDLSTVFTEVRVSF
jgi:hypothetical protein